MQKIFRAQINNLRNNRVNFHQLKAYQNDQIKIYNNRANKLNNNK